MRKMPEGLPKDWYEKYQSPEAVSKELRIELENLHKIRKAKGYVCPKCECPLARPTDLKSMEMECSRCGHRYKVNSDGNG